MFVLPLPESHRLVGSVTIEPHPPQLQFHHRPSTAPEVHAFVSRGRGQEKGPHCGTTLGLCHGDGDALGALDHMLILVRSQLLDIIHYGVGSEAGGNCLLALGPMGFKEKDETFCFVLYDIQLWAEGRHQENQRTLAKTCTRRWNRKWIRKTEEQDCER